MKKWYLRPISKKDMFSECVLNEELYWQLLKQMKPISYNALEHD